MNSINTRFNYFRFLSIGTTGVQSVLLPRHFSVLGASEFSTNCILSILISKELYLLYNTIPLNVLLSTHKLEKIY